MEDAPVNVGAALGTLRRIGLYDQWNSWGKALRSVTDTLQNMTKRQRKTPEGREALRLYERERIRLMGDLHKRFAAVEKLDHAGAKPTYRELKSTLEGWQVIQQAVTESGSVGPRVTERIAAVVDHLQTLLADSYIPVAEEALQRLNTATPDHVIERARAIADLHDALVTTSNASWETLERFSEEYDRALRSLKNTLAQETTNTVIPTAATLATVHKLHQRLRRAGSFAQAASVVQELIPASVKQNILTLQSRIAKQFEITATTVFTNELDHIAEAVTPALDKATHNPDVVSLPVLRTLVQHAQTLKRLRVVMSNVGYEKTTMSAVHQQRAHLQTRIQTALHQAFLRQFTNLQTRFSTLTPDEQRVVMAYLEKLAGLAVQSADVFVDMKHSATLWAKQTQKLSIELTERLARYEHMQVICAAAPDFVDLYARLPNVPVNDRERLFDVCRTIGTYWTPAQQLFPNIDALLDWLTAHQFDPDQVAAVKALAAMPRASHETGRLSIEHLCRLDETGQWLQSKMTEIFFSQQWSWWHRMFVTHCESRLHDPSHDPRHGTDTLTDSATPVLVRPVAGWHAWVDHVSQQPIPALSDAVRDQLRALLDTTQQRLQGSTTRPPDGWKARIQDTLFRQWGWKAIGVHSAAYAWGHVRLDTADTSYAFTVGPDTLPPDLSHDAMLVAYTWLLAWVEAASSAKSFSPRVPRQNITAALGRFRSRSRHQTTRRFHVDRRWGSAGLRRPGHRPAQQSHHAVLPHPVCSHRRWVRPDFVASPERQEQARIALVDLPMGYTFVPQHWSPMFNAHTEVAWIHVQWAPHTQMRVWRSIMEPSQLQLQTL